MKLGAGCTVKIMDRSLICTPAVVNMMIDCAEENGIAYQREVLPYGGTDAGAMQKFCAGGSIAGKLAASFLPFLKMPIAAGITYGVGKAAKAYFESDMTMDISELKQKFLEGEREAKKREWKGIEED